LFDEEQQCVKLTDFGFSVHVRDPSKRLTIFCGTPSYMAPEITQRKEYVGRPVDVWSLAVLLFAMLAGYFPFTAKTYVDLYKKIGTAQFKCPDAMSASVRDLLRRMLHPDPARRLTLAGARVHPWVTGGAEGEGGREGGGGMPSPQPSDKSLLISDDPSRDVNEAVLQRSEQLGFKRARVVEAILSRAKNAAAASYYLLLTRLGRGAKASAPPASSAPARPSTAGQLSRPSFVSSTTFAAAQAHTKAVAVGAAAKGQAATLLPPTGGFTRPAPRPPETGGGGGGGYEGPPRVSAFDRVQAPPGVAQHTRGDEEEGGSQRGGGAGAVLQRPRSAVPSVERRWAPGGEFVDTTPQQRPVAAWHPGGAPGALPSAPTFARPAPVMSPIAVGRVLTMRGQGQQGE